MKRPRLLIEDWLPAAAIGVKVGERARHWGEKLRLCFNARMNRRLMSFPLNFNGKVGMGEEHE